MTDSATATGRSLPCREGFAPSPIGVRVRNGTSQLVMVECPRCRRHLSVTRYGGPQEKLHPSRGGGGHTGSCRIIVTPDPSADDFDRSHRIHDVDEVASRRGLARLSVEDLLDELSHEWEAEFGIGSHIRRRLAI